MARARKLQILRGTATQNNLYTGDVGELTLDTTSYQVRVHDGATEGGVKIAKDADVVHTSGVENIAGSKTFTEFVYVPAPTIDASASTKKYVDDSLSAKANLSGATFSGGISATNLSGTNTGDETQSTIKTKLGAATTSVDGYLTSTDWNTFNGKQDVLININHISSGTTNAIYYIDGTNGSDETGTGTQLLPWKTLEHCLSVIPSIIENRTDIVLAAGSYTVTAAVNDLLSWFTILDGSLRIYGTMSLVRNDFTASTQTPDANNPFERVVSGMTWDANAYTGKFVSNGNVEQYLPIGKHGANSLNYVFDKNYTKGIYECLTTLVLERSLLCPQNSSGAFFIRNMIVDVNSNNTKIMGSESCSTNFNSCVINCKTYVGLQTYGSADYWRCAFIGTSTATALTNGIYQLNKTNKHQRGSFKVCSFISMNDQRGTGLESLGQDIYIQDVQFQGFETAMYLRNGLSVFINTVHNASKQTVLAIDNCKSFVYMVGSGFYWNLTNLFKVYFKTLSYGFCLHPYTTNNVQLDFRNIIQNSAAPSIAWLNPSCYVPSDLIDLTKNFVLLYPGALGFTPANDSAVVHNTGNETIAGVKTFSSSPIVPTPTTDYQAATKKYVDDNAGGGGGILDTGDIKASLATTISGWILCNGQAVSRTTYSNLFTLIGESFGAGDGSTTFNVPDYRGAFLRGLDDGTLTAGDVYTKQLDAAPNITGSMSSTVGRQNIGSVSGAFTRSGTGTGYYGGDGHSNMAATLTISASNSSASYGRDSTTEVRPTNFAVNLFIKY